MLERYAEIASLVWKYADRDLIERAGLEEAMTAGSRPEPAPKDDRPAQLAREIDTDFTILGYPGLAMLLFLAAAFGGFLLVYRVMRGDDR